MLDRNRSLWCHNEVLSVTILPMQLLDRRVKVRAIPEQVQGEVGQAHSRSTLPTGGSGLLVGTFFPSSACGVSSYVLTRREHCRLIPLLSSLNAASASAASSVGCCGAFCAPSSSVGCCGACCGAFCAPSSSSVGCCGAFCTPSSAIAPSAAIVILILDHILEESGGLDVKLPNLATIGAALLRRSPHGRLCSVGSSKRGRVSGLFILCIDHAVAVDILTRSILHALLDSRELLGQVTYYSSTCDWRATGRTLDDFFAHPVRNRDLVELSIYKAFSDQVFLIRLNGTSRAVVDALLGRQVAISDLIALRRTGTSQAAHANYGQSGR